MGSVLKLCFDVVTLDGKTLVEAGTEVTEAVLTDVAAMAPAGSWPEVPLLQFGTVSRDVKLLMRHSAYEHLLDDECALNQINDLMERVLLPLPILESLNHFRENEFYTYRHILMVFALASCLTRSFGGDSRQSALEAASGPLHDVGKICVPVEILRKREVITRGERQALRDHAAAGYVLLAYYLGNAEALAAHVARDHHERRDGSGYPRGIDLDDLHTEVVTACDVYDALITSRPYRRGNYDSRTALEELTKMAEEGKLGWEVVRRLVALHRRDRPEPDACVVSLDKRGAPPVDNNYGKLEEEP